jgi:hypothetical protein
MTDHDSVHDFDEDDSNFPFAELDTYSKELRQTAFEFAELLSDIETDSKEINLLIMSLTKVNTININQMDQALNNFKKAFSAVTIRNTDNSIFGPGISDELLPLILDKYSSFIKQTCQLAEKAIELNNRPV